ncbi:MAG: hypothetical protein HY043_20135, partial [Verrucomicrobia bacterium]|nr:hypothetical protein [Verrucomicrobiota bacterium]
IPGLEMSRVEFAEGGLLSADRVYLRMTRERLVFDVCAAPFGTAYFFSCRFAELPLAINPLVLLGLFIGVFVFLGIFIKFFGLVLGSLALLVLLPTLVWLLRNSVSLGLKNLDATLLKTPGIGPIYERFFRKETYYRVDTRLMYLDTVNAVVMAKVEEASGAKGIKLIRFNEHSPILGDLYKAKTVELTKPASP